MERLLFCAEFHGNLHQVERALGRALAAGVGYVVFGGDLTPKDAAPRTPAFQRVFLRDELIPLFRAMVDPDRLAVLLILGNDDFRSNREFVLDQQCAGAPFLFKCWERRDLTGDMDFSARPDTRTEGVISPGDELVPCSLDEGLALPSIEEDLFAPSDGLHMDRLVLVTHASPFGTVCDFNREQKHVGSRGVRAFIEARQPYLTLHGHIRETVALTGEFVQRIGRTRCVAVGNDHRLERPWVVEVVLDGDEPVLRRYRV